MVQPEYNSEVEGIDNLHGEGAGDSDIEGTGNLDRYLEIGKVALGGHIRVLV